MTSVRSLASLAADRAVDGVVSIVTPRDTQNQHQHQHRPVPIKVLPSYGVRWLRHADMALAVRVLNGRDAIPGSAIRAASNGGLYRSPLALGNSARVALLRPPPPLQPL